MRLIRDRLLVPSLVLLAVVVPVVSARGEVGLPEAKRVAPAATLYVGWAQRSITPDEPVALWGQKYLRISKRVLDPVTCTALAIETKDGNKSVEQAMMVSCDLVGVTREVQDKVREKIETKLEGFDARKLFINATHTHTAPILSSDGKWYEVPKEGLMQPADYVTFLVERIAAAAVEAWENRKAAQVSWGLGQAVVGHNRRPTYSDGKAVMYGKADKENFKDIEGYEDHGVEMLFFRDKEGPLTGMLINVACPSQETEQLYEISADFWCEVREGLRKQYGKELYVFPQCGAAGDISPHLILQKRSEEEMLRRKGITGRQEIASCIIKAVNDVYPYASEAKSKVVFDHTADYVKLPVREKGGEPFEVDLHVIRLDDVAICTNPFELYLDYGIRMKARSKAKLTMVSQLTSDYGGYVPTKKAVAGGGYSAEDFRVGPEGGTELANETLWRINEMWGY